MWLWWLGKGTASERSHLLQRVGLLPAATWLVADAGYFGFDLIGRLLAARVCFWPRMSSNVTLYTVAKVRRQRSREGPVYYGPLKQPKQGPPPLRLRRLRIRARKQKHDVWLLTNVLEPRRWSATSARRF